MEFARFEKATPKPCLTCCKHELLCLQEEYEKGQLDFWVYRIPVWTKCRRCDEFHAKGRFMKYAGTIAACLCEPPIQLIDVPIKVETVGIIERAIHSSTIGEKGSEYRAHGTFIKHLVGGPETEEYKQSLCTWAPTAMMAYMLAQPQCSRKYRRAALTVTDAPSTPQPHDSSTGAGTPKSETSATLKPEEMHQNGNPDSDGKLIATQLKGDEYGEEDRVQGEFYQLDPKVGAFQIGPDLIPTEVMDSTKGNLQAGLAKRVKPLPFKPSSGLARKIDRTVSQLINKIFTKEAIGSWREQVAFEELKSKKWSTKRWHQAWDEALMDLAEIEQTFQIKQNEALPAKGKAPRPIIQCGDVAQVMMKYPVKCFEDLLFDFFEDASIKHLPKHEAMGRVAAHLRIPRRRMNLIEGDGSAWDSCCGPKIRAMTENRIIRHIISHLGKDPEVPEEWMDKMLADLEKPRIFGKVKGNGHQITTLRVLIDAIRQSGHTGTSCFNWLINFVCWICVLAKEPWKLIGKSKEGNLYTHYDSALNGEPHQLKYAFEGDDSAISSTQNFLPFQAQIESAWKSLGFRMKLVFVEEKLTFTGFEFLCDAFGPTGDFVPEIARNIASSSWSCSSLLKMKPNELHRVGAAAMLARACNFKDCGAYSRYFAALGLAHARKIEDFALEEAESLSLGIQVSPSVKDDLQALYDSAEPLTDSIRKLVNLTAPMSHEDELRLLQVDFGTDPFNTQLARELVPFEVWDPAKFEQARRA